MLLDKDYFQNADTIFLARDLIGKSLVCQRDDLMFERNIIIETEAYHGETDKACHARFGKTARNQIMYQTGGVWYVYLCYGIHWLLNIVTGSHDFPAAILIRGINCALGPGRVTKLLGINKRFNGLPANRETGLWLEDEPLVKPLSIQATPRIGVDYAGEYAKKPWRFVAIDYQQKPNFHL